MCADQIHFNRHPEQAAKRRVELFVVEVRGTEHQKAPQAGSTESLMNLFVTKEMFYHNGCKFTYVGVDQTLRRPLNLQAGLGFAPSAVAFHQPEKNSLPVFHVGGIPLSLHHTQCADYFRKTSTRRKCGLLRVTVRVGFWLVCSFVSPT